MEEQLQEKAVLVGLNITTNVKKIDDIDINESMAELKELVKAAGAEVLASVIQNKPARDAAYFIGKGKVEEIRDYCHMLGATMIVQPKIRLSLLLWLLRQAILLTPVM